MNNCQDTNRVPYLLDIRSLFLLLSRARNPIMPLIKPQHTISTFLVALCLALGILACPAWGEEADETLGLFSAWQEEASTASRAPKPLSQTAENVTVVTAPEIEAINAHTLADVLDTIPGIQIQHNGGPGITAYTFIQSTDFIHTQVYVDGVSITNVSSGFSDVSLIPANIIERVEIVKGAASSAWGQALGGVINVITKSPERGRTISGTATASIGERTTTDDSLELSGARGRLGYYLSGSLLDSKGVLPNTRIDSNRAYAKLAYDLPNHGQLWGTYFYTHADMGDLHAPAPAYDLDEKPDKLFMLGSLGVRYPLGDRLELEVSGHHSFNRTNNSYFNISDGAIWSWQTSLPTSIVKEQVSGASAKLVWRGENNLLVAGSDYNHLELFNNSSDGSTVSPFTRRVDRWGIYLNDTVTVGPVSVTPGVRFDHTQTAGDQFSPSIGATWQLTGATLLRAYTARGYGLPVLGLTDSPSVKIWTTQVGAESSAIPYIWAKGTLFRNQTWGNTVEQHMALGTELEIRTIPVWNTSLGTGYTFTDTTRTSDGNEVNNYARHTVQVALRYNDKTYRGVLTGRHIFWNSDPSENGHYGGLLWDLHLGATLLKRENSSLEVFFSAHNLFNGAQYYFDQIPNPGRWFEGGMRVRF
ncbi:TonB-dependent siderophore receptor [Geobacter sp. AOG2]|uniref:TonB-dependent receptor plug domain-containing protein n=1 Tax=Geobacter sp. AOG2 TaxID=1566347 RepID=UPI001CC4DD9C|nr:TonB-dependent receptor plug domain-containing protein [Geobacter sp. AOG2]GFE61456.1 ligand-gated channel [Geobacter sp. AOG2]